MRTEPACRECYRKNALEQVRKLHLSDAVRDRILREAEEIWNSTDKEKAPPEMMGRLYGTLSKITGIKDLYAEEKRESNHLAEEMLARLSERIAMEKEPFYARARLAIGGNLLDCAIQARMNAAETLEKVWEAMQETADDEKLRLLKRHMDAAPDILYILDNCGEAVFDRELLTEYREKVTLAVRGCAVINDVTRADLRGCGLEGFAGRVVDTGNGTPGADPDGCGDEFAEAFRTASLVIAKGQGNFETLYHRSGRPQFLLLRAKCPVVAGELGGAALNSMQIVTENLEKAQYEY